MANFYRSAPAILFLMCQLLPTLPAMADEQIRGGRETGGYIEQKGWESGLVKANPNLGHFMWSPMTTMIQVPFEIKAQTTMHMTQKPPLQTSSDPNNPNQPNQNSPRIVERTPYIKPNHVPMPVVADNHDLSGRVIPRSHYIKPNKVDLSGKLLPKDQEELNGRLLPKPPGGNQGDVYGQLANKNTNAQLLKANGLGAGPGGALQYGTGPRAEGNTNYQARADVSGQVVSRGSLLRSH
jgi:hypothetical protein